MAETKKTKKTKEDLERDLKNAQAQLEEMAAHLNRAHQVNRAQAEEAERPAARRSTLAERLAFLEKEATSFQDATVGKVESMAAELHLLNQRLGAVEAELNIK